MDVHSPFNLSLSSFILIDSFTGEGCPRLDVVHPGCVWSSSPGCTWHCSLHYLFLQAIPLFLHGVTMLVFLLDNVENKDDQVTCRKIVRLSNDAA